MARNSRALPRLRRAAIDSLEARQMLAATEYITNGNFSSNSANWTLTGDFHADAAVSTTDGLSNPGYAYLSAADGATADSNNLAGSISQTVTMPTAVNSAQLSYWYKTTTEETAGSNDTVNVKIKNATTGATLATISTIYNTTMGSYVQAGPFDLSSYAGQTIAISFDGTTNATNGTVFRVDNVSLQIDVPPPPPPPAVVITPTLAAPGVPSGTTLPTINTSTPTVRWNAVAGATGYGVTISKQSGGTTNYTTVYNSESAPFGSPIKGLMFTPPVAMTAGNYRWTVRAFDSSGNATPYAQPLYFTLAVTGFSRATGMDISHYQTVTSWANIKTNGTTSTTADDISFVWAKATEGVGYTDPSYASFISGATNAGVTIGAYHFARPNLVNDTTAYATQIANDAVAEANYFFSTISSTLAAGRLVPMLDFEATLDRDTNNDGTNDVGLSLTTAQIKTLMSQWVNVFCDTITSSIASTGITGIVPIIYTYTSFSASYMDSTVTRYPLWMAAYPISGANPPVPTTPGTVSANNPASTTPWPANVWTAWQYTDARTVSGVGSVDGDVWDGDVAAIDELRLPSIVKGSITGTLFNDTNGDGIQNNGETGIAGRTVYLDADGDGVFDHNETTATTNASGFYQFTSLLSGTYRVREVVPANSVETGVSNYTFQLSAGQALGTRDFGSRAIDVTPPTLASSHFNYDHADQSITLVFSEDVGASIATSDVVLTNITTGTTTPVTLTYNAATLTATVTPTSTLANGDYQLVIAAGNISDAAGNPNAEVDVSFFSLAGDANRDRSVNFDDLVIVAQNYGTTAGATYAQGDFNGDGAVNFDDLVLVAQNYGQSLGSMIVAGKAAAASNVASTTPGAAKSAAAANKKKPSQDILA